MCPLKSYIPFPGPDGVAFLLLVLVRRQSPAENIAEASDIDRAAQDAFALESHRRAAVAIDAGYFEDQIAPITVRQGRAEVEFKVDEHVRPSAKAEDMEKLRPAFKKDGSVTPGNSSGINDGAAALILADSETAAAKDLPVLATIRAAAVAGVAPEIMGQAG